MKFFWLFFSVFLTALIYIGIQNTNKELLSLSGVSGLRVATTTVLDEHKTDKRDERGSGIFDEIQTAENDDIVVSSPTPLVHYGTPPEINLLSNAVLEWTNHYRKQAGVSELKRDELLDSAAIIKMRDMFEQEYFEHVSPTGVHMGMLVDNVGYEFITVGENLAMGIFEDEKTLVDAWMASPGHRENLLKRNFEEIGIAVGKDVYKGETIWIAVQEFARPSSACPSPQSVVKEKIDENVRQIETLTVAADALKRELDEDDDPPGVYNKKVSEYNALVQKINPLIELTQSLIADYNKGVSLYNICVKGEK